MPIKMAQGLIRAGHEFSVPIGTITGLIERENRVEGIAALWSREYPEEVKILEDMSSAGEKPQISWEILYKDSINDEGIESLQDTQLTAATVVGLPAYNGRTPILSMASINKEGKSPMDEKELEKLQADFAALTEENKTLKGSLETLTNQISDLQKAHDVLAAFKADIDTKAEKEAKVVSIKKMFEDAGIELPEDYFTDDARAAQLLSMSTDQLSYVIQEFALFSKRDSSSSASTRRLGDRNLPNLSGKPEDFTPKEIAMKLREELSKK
jgi:hypothetical protein